MKRKKKRCCWCKDSFVVDFRLGDRQKSCGKSGCKRKQKLLSHQLWKKKEKKVYRKNQGDWRRNNPGYWRAYRIRNPAYTLKNRHQSRIRKKFSLKKTGLQKRIDILQMTEKRTEFWSTGRFAKSPQSLIPLLFVYASRCEGSIQAEKIGGTDTWTRSG